jgi:GT2 family glycosyltransferase
MQIHCSNPDWTVSHLTPRTVTLRCSHPHVHQWHHIRVKAAGIGTQLDTSSIFIRRNLHGQASPLLPGRRVSEVELIFFHSEKLQSLQLEFPHDLASLGHSIELEISRCRSLYAIAKMLHTVSRKDRAAGNDPTLIFRKSAKRWRVHGRQRFMTKLIHDYHPQEVTHYEAGDAYARWIHAVELAESPDPISIKTLIDALAVKPLISILISSCGNSARHLHKAIESVRTQSYPHWELCIACNAAPNSEIGRILGRNAADDPRVRILGAPDDGAAATTSNPILQWAKGRYFARLQPDDMLAEHALYQVVRTITVQPDAAIIYSDEDNIDEHGRRFHPHFKCDWNPDLFLSNNYISQLCIYLRAVVDTIAEDRGLHAGSDGDYDLLLRCLPYIQPAQIVHIPLVLYHRRTATNAAAIPERKDDHGSRSELAALRDYFAAQGRPDIQVEQGIAPETHRVRYPVPDPAPLVSLLIPTRDKLELLEPCVRSILDKTSYQNYEILILDNESAESETLDFFSRIQTEEKRVRVLPYHHPFNYSAINNYGVRHANGQLIGLINNDVEVIGPDWLTEMVSHACRPEIGCVGAKLYYDDNTIQHAGVILGLWGVAGHAHKHFARNAEGYHKRAQCIQNYSAVTAACLVVRKHIYHQLGGLNEADLTVAFNDVDFCIKVREAGYRNLWTPYAELYHHESVTRGAEDTPEKKARERREIEYMRATWPTALARDPYYSPNLTHRWEDFSINADFARP